MAAFHGVEPNIKRPILVTGAHRSGTTWIGKMLAADPQVAYISEPLNVWHRPGVMRADTAQWYTYICQDNENQYLTAFRETISFQYHPRLEIGSLRSLKDLMRMGRDWWIFTKGSITDQIPLIKDPFAIFSTEWFAKKFNCQVVIVIRHPAAVASSLMRLGWRFDFSDLLNQPLLMRDWLEQFRGEIESIVKADSDVISQSSLLWRIVYYVADELRKIHPEFHIVRHEDFSLNPLAEFNELYDNLDLDYSQKVQQKITTSSQTGNPVEISHRNAHSVKVNSQANLENWKQRLTPADIDRVHQLTSDVAGEFYAAEDWLFA